MFTGIVSEIGAIIAAEDRGDLRVRVKTATSWTDLAIGASVSCSGACLTVVAAGPGWFDVDVSDETMKRTAVGRWIMDEPLNLERALKVGDELGGHIVTGHVDGVGTVVSLDPQGESTRLTVRADAALAPFVAAKGSITLDGVSLTVNDVADQDDGAIRFTINLIPHTAAVTTLGQLSVGDELNIEIDVLARYLGRMREAMQTA